MRRLFILLLSLSLAACGFQLRGSYSLPWDTLYLGMPENSEMYAQIKRSVEASTQTRIVTDPKAAQASLVILRNEQAKNILSLSGTGLVREFQLTRTFVYRIQDTSGKELIPASQIILQREMNFDDTRIFASEAEEHIIWRDIQTDLVQQILRRLSAGSRAAPKT
jgi:LPS-assembly lipoprotein